MTETEQIRIWKSGFGTEYTHRCVTDWHNYAPAWAQILEGVNLSRILEVGCNRGHNLIALSKMFEHAEIVGIEPNGEALNIAKTACTKMDVREADVFDIPFEDSYFDLVFTAGVLMTVTVDDLPAALQEMHRSSRRYILAVEYFAEQETTINYRGYDNLLWKRNYPKHFQECLPHTRLVRQGYFDESTWPVWQNCHWWLFEKSC